MNNQFFKHASPQDIAAATGCTPATARRWHSLGDAMPEMARRLLKFYTAHDLPSIFGRDWKGFSVYQGRLVCDLWTDGITPIELRKLFFMAKECHYLRGDVQAQKNALTALNLRCETLERDNRFFRDQAKQDAAAQTMLKIGLF